MVPVDRLPIPQISPPLSAAVEKSIFLQYEKPEEIAIVIPSEIAEMREQEKARIQAGSSQLQAEQESYLRHYYNQIPQPDKPGPNGATAPFLSASSNCRI